MQHPAADCGQGVEADGAGGGDHRNDAQVDQHPLSQVVQLASAGAADGQRRPESVHAELDGQVDLVQSGRGMPFHPEAHGAGDAGGQRRQGRGDGGRDGQDRAQGRQAGDFRGGYPPNGQGKLAHLRHCHSDLHRRARVAAGQDGTDDVGDDFAGHKDGDHHQRGQDVIVNGAVVNQHTDGQEKEGAEHIAHGVDQAGNASGHFGVADDDADKKGAGGAGQTQQVGAQGQSETDAQAGDEHGFVGFGAGDAAHQADDAGGQQGADDEHGGAEQAEAAGQQGGIGEAGRTGQRQAAQDGEENDGGEILNEQDADDGLAPAGTQAAAVAQPFEQDGGAADGESAAEIQGIDAVNVQDGAGDPHSEQGEDADLNDADDEDAKADAADAAPA